MSPIIFRAGHGKPCRCCHSETKGCSLTENNLAFCRGEPSPGWAKVGSDDNGFTHYRMSELNIASGKRSTTRTTSNKNWKQLAEKFAQQLTPELKAMLVQSLCFPQDAFNGFPMLGFCSLSGGFYTYPECDAAGTIIGISKRFMDGIKRTMKGSKRGLILPTRWQDYLGPVFVFEGFTDTVAMALAGIACVGRPSNSSGAKFLIPLLSEIPLERQIIIAGENDQKDNGSWPGREGAESLAAQLATALKRPIHWALPPAGYKDARAWLTATSRNEMPWSERGKALAEGYLENVVEIQPSTPDVDAEDDDHFSSDKPLDSKQTLEEIVKIAKQHFVFYREPTEDGRTFVRREGRCSLVNTKSFLRMLRNLIYRARASNKGDGGFIPIPTDETLRTAVQTLDAHAYHEGHLMPLYTRVAKIDAQSVEIDLSSTECTQVISVTGNGWSLNVDSTTCFLQRGGMKPLPTPVSGTALSAIKSLLNIGNETDFRLLLSWMTWSVLPFGPYPILCLTGEQGSAKSTTARVIRSLLDPHVMPLRSPPRNEEDLFIGASNCWIMALDNLSSIPAWLSDALCRLATG